MQHRSQQQLASRASIAPVPNSAQRQCSSSTASRQRVAHSPARAVPLPVPQVSVVVLCHTRELAFQICHEYER